MAPNEHSSPGDPDRSEPVPEQLQQRKHGRKAARKAASRAHQIDNNRDSAQYQPEREWRQAGHAGEQPAEAERTAKWRVRHGRAKGGAPLRSAAGK